MTCDDIAIRAQYVRTLRPIRPTSAAFNHNIFLLLIVSYLFTSPPQATSFSPFQSFNLCGRTTTASTNLARWLANRHSSRSVLLTNSPSLLRPRVLCTLETHPTNPASRISSHPLPSKKKTSSLFARLNVSSDFPPSPLFSSLQTTARCDLKAAASLPRIPSTLRLRPPPSFAPSHTQRSSANWNQLTLVPERLAFPLRWLLVALAPPSCPPFGPF